MERLAVQDWGEAVGEGSGGIFADDAAEDSAVAIEDDVGGEGGGAVMAHFFAMGIEALRPIHPVCGDKLLPGLLAVIFADADDFETVAAVNGLKLLQIRE